MKVLEEEKGETENRNSGLARIGVSLPSNLLDKFDKIIRGRGYSSRSEGIRDSIRAYIIEYEWRERESGEKIGVITYTYDTNQRGLRSELMGMENDFRDIIEASNRVLIDNRSDFATITIKGKAERIKELTDAIMSRNGVKSVKLTTH